MTITDPTTARPPRTPPLALDAARAALRARLLADGVLIDLGSPGLYGRTGVFERVSTPRSTPQRSAARRDLDAEVLRFPPVEPLAAFERTDYIASFPDLAASISGFTGDDRTHRALLAARERGERWEGFLEPADLMLTPAVCHPVYGLVGDTCPQQGRCFDIVGDSFRREPSLDPMRLQAFHMHEFVHVGTPASAQAHRDGRIPVMRDAARVVRPRDRRRPRERPLLRPRRADARPQPGRAGAQVRVRHAGLRRRPTTPPRSARRTCTRTTSAPRSASAPRTARSRTAPASRSAWSASPSPCSPRTARTSTPGRPTSARPSPCDHAATAGPGRRPSAPPSSSPPSPRAPASSSARRSGRRASSRTARSACWPTAWRPVAWPRCATTRPDVVTAPPDTDPGRAGPVRTPRRRRAPHDGGRARRLRRAGLGRPRRGDRGRRTTDGLVRLGRPGVGPRLAPPAARPRDHHHRCRPRRRRRREPRRHRRRAGRGRRHSRPSRFAPRTGPTVALVRPGARAAEGPRRCRRDRGHRQRRAPRRHEHPRPHPRSRRRHRRRLARHLGARRRRCPSAPPVLDEVLDVDGRVSERIVHLGARSGCSRSRPSRPPSTTTPPSSCCTAVAPSTGWAPPTTRSSSPAPSPATAPGSSGSTAGPPARAPPCATTSASFLFAQEWVEDQSAVVTALATPSDRLVLVGMCAGAWVAGRAVEEAPRLVVEISPNDYRRVPAEPGSYADGVRAIDAPSPAPDVGARAVQPVRAEGRPRPDRPSRPDAAGSSATSGRSSSTAPTSS